MIYATFCDDLSYLMDSLRFELWYLVILAIVFICLASLTVMNMLVGVLCEVVSAVAKTEKEELALSVVKAKVETIFYDLGLDDDHNGMISKDEFVKIVENK